VLFYAFAILAYQLPSPVGRYNVTRKHMDEITASLISMGYQFILLDCPAGIDVGFINAIAPAKEALITTTPEITSIRDAGTRPTRNSIGLLWQGEGAKVQEIWVIKCMGVDRNRCSDLTEGQITHLCRPRGRPAGGKRHLQCEAPGQPSAA
jgi:septum formation inhibitor-activating ATPase MinD